SMGVSDNGTAESALVQRFCNGLRAQSQALRLRAQRLRRLLDVPGSHPTKRAVPAVGAYGIDRCDVDLSVGERAGEIGDGTNAIVALDQESSFGPDDSPLVRFRRALESRGILRDEVELGASPGRESRKCQKVHASVLQGAQHSRAFPSLLCHLYVVVVHQANR